MIWFLCLLLRRWDGCGYYIIVVYFKFYEWIIGYFFLCYDYYYFFWIVFVYVEGLVMLDLDVIYCGVL